MCVGGLLAGTASEAHMLDREEQPRLWVWTFES